MKVKFNKANASLNGEWAKHVRGNVKRYTSHVRRRRGREYVRKELISLNNFL